MSTEIAENKNKLPTLNGDDPYLAAASRALSESNFLKFQKGVYVYGVDDEELPIGTLLVPNMPEAKAGWLKWQSGEVVDEKMAPFSAGGYAYREDLGDLDRDAWAVDDDGRPTDPWSETFTLPFKDPAMGQEFTFTTSSVGGRRAVGKLVQAWRYGLSRGESGLPIVEIGTDSYKHRKYGKVDFPTLTIKRWADEADLMAGDAVELDDSLPF